MSQAASLLVPPAPAPFQPDAAEVVRHLAHELRQPLSAIESVAYYLRMTMPQHESKQRLQLDRLDQMVELAEWILTDAVHYLEAASAAPQLLDLHEVLAEELTAREMEDRRRTIDIEPRRALVRMDVAQARHLVRSLFAVGHKMSRSASMMHLRAWVENCEVLVKLSLPEVEYRPDQLSSLFEPFAPHQPASLGLALAGAVRIVQRHGGRVEAESAPGCGTWLLVRLPLVE